MQPSHQPPDTSDTSEEGDNTTQAPRLPSLFSSHFLQALFLCVVALASAIVQIRGGSRIDAVLATGIGLFLGWLIYPKRLFILAVLVLPLGIINQLYDSNVISGRFIEPAHLLVLALGLLAITWAMRSIPTWAHPRALSPGLVVAALGLLLLLADASASASRLIFSFWLPTAVLGALGLWYVLVSAFGRVKP